MMLPFHATAADSGVGKSCILERCVRDTANEGFAFRDAYVPTTGTDLKKRLLDVHGVEAKLHTVRRP
jgi:GTPase SAR1 family protein